MHRPTEDEGLFLLCPLVENEQQRQYFINMVKNAPKVPDVSEAPSKTYNYRYEWFTTGRKGGKTIVEQDEAQKVLNAAREAQKRIERERDRAREDRAIATLYGLPENRRLPENQQIRGTPPPQQKSNSKRAADDLPLVTAGERKYLSDEE